LRQPHASAGGHEEEGTMKITGYEVIPIQRRAILLKVFTDAGITGIGEPLDYGHGDVVAKAIEVMFEYLVGKDPRQIEDHWQQLYRETYSRDMPILLGALSGIDQALWDILGKSLGVPVWRLLGGSVRDRIRVYGGAGGATPEQCAENARRTVERGFTALKMTPFGIARPIENAKYLADAAAKVAAVREAVGPEVDIAIDFHRRLTPAMAIRMLKELEPYQIMFAEEPCHPENDDALLQIARSTATPIATGERHTTRWGFREIIEKEAAAVLQPDIRHCGGISELRKIAAMAEVHYIHIAPHSAAGAVGVAASIQVDAAMPNLLIQEFGGGNGEGLFVEPLKLVEGHIELPQGPGLGIEIDDEKLAALRVEQFHRRPMLRHADGSVADH
jgi:galactonate dehydratase